MRKTGGKKKKYRLLKAAAVLVLIVAVAAAGDIVLNHFGADYSELSETDQKLLSEYEKYCTNIANDPEFEGFSLSDKPVLFMIDGRAGRGYLVNPEKDPGSLFAQNIKLPSGFGIKVYRISRSDPSLFKMRMTSAFNAPDSDGKYDESRYHVTGNNVFFVRYNDGGSNGEPTDRHLTGFAVHEAFHYYMQRNWLSGERYQSELIGKKEMEGLIKKYDILTKMNEKMTEKSPDLSVLKSMTAEYVSNEKSRLKASPELMKSELAMETVEGSARYVEGIALEAAGLEQIDLDYSKLIELYNKGSIGKDLFSDEVPYHTGAQLCRLMDLLGIKDWQKRLSSQTKSEPVMLYDILAEYVANTVK